jgi:uncharacterized protein YuzE
MSEKIHVRYDPTSLDKAYIFTEDGKLTDTIFPINKLENSKVRREQNVKSVDFSPFAST